MKNKQDNLRGFRGLLRREIRNIENEARAMREQEALKKSMDHIKIHLLGNANQQNDFMFIRLSFKKPIVPNQFIPEIRFCLEEIFNEHF
jgi:hypothetical protein